MDRLGRKALLLEHALLHEVDELFVRQPQNLGLDLIVVLAFRQSLIDPLVLTDGIPYVIPGGVMEV
jgi:hypothetical protein